ncbi:MAG: hypothetical protein MJ184_03150 [Treponema sp.]|uniref:hypothetical protein n=1 Tax=Treponema sp. TaxID=166 RepID=UPI00298E6F22|nr:hypothetical protein [Treponema sp.]MCQ2600338.1 hypothetical protein [Treponema sp.]
MIFLCALDLYAQENIQTASSDGSPAEEKSETKKNIIPEYEHILDSSSRLHLFTYKDENLEHFAVHNSNKSSGRSLIQHTGRKTKRFFYDDQLKLFCVELWNIEKKVADSSLEKITYYFYTTDIAKTKYSKRDFSIEVKEIALKDNKLFQFFYDVSGLLIEKNEYSIMGVDEKHKIEVSDKYREIPFSLRREYSFFYKYDSAGQIVSEEEIHNEYRTESALRVNKTTTRKNIYEYLDSNCPPVTTFYENNILRMKTIYSSEKDYVQNIYFDSNNYVKVQFKDGRKISEVFYIDGKAYEQ